MPIAVENFRMLRDRQTSGVLVDTDDRRGRVNLLNWDGKGRPTGLLPPRRTDDGGAGGESEPAP